MPSHYLNQCWIIVNWTLANTFQWKFNQNTTIFIEENAFENVVWKMAAIFLGLIVLKIAIQSHWVLYMSLLTCLQPLWCWECSMTTRSTWSLCKRFKWSSSILCFTKNCLHYLEIWTGTFIHWTTSWLHYMVSSNDIDVQLKSEIWFFTVIQIHTCISVSNINHTHISASYMLILSSTLYGSGHETAAVLLPGFAINW